MIYIKRRCSPRKTDFVVATSGAKHFVPWLLSLVAFTVYLLDFKMICAGQSHKASYFLEPWVALLQCDVPRREWVHLLDLDRLGQILSILRRDSGPLVLLFFCS